MENVLQPACTAVLNMVLSQEFLWNHDMEDKGKQENTRSALLGKDTLLSKRISHLCPVR